MDLKLSLIVEAIDRLSAPFKRMEEAVSGPVRAARAQMKELEGTFNRISGSVGSIAATVGGGLAIRDIIKDNDAFERLRINAGVSAERIQNLRDSILETAQRVRVPVDELTASFREMRDAGLSLDEAQGNLETAAVAIQRLNGQGEGVGNLFAMLSRFSNVKGPEQLLETMAMFKAQMKGVNDGFENFMVAAPSLLSAYAALGHTGIAGAREIAGLYATVAPGTATPRQARGVVQNILDLIGSREGATRLEQLGVHVYGHTAEERATNARAGVTLPVTEIVQELLKRYTLAPFMFDDMLGASFKRDFKVPLGEVKQFGYSPTLQGKLGTEGDPQKFLKESGEAAQTFSASLNALGAALKHIGDSVLSGPLKMFADTLASYPGIAAAAITAVAGLAILGTVGSWAIAGASQLAMLSGVVSAGIGIFGNFFVALRAGYGVMAAFNLILMANPIGVVIMGIAALAAAAVLVYKNWEPIKDFFASLWEDVVGAFEWAWSKLKPIVEPIIQAATFIGKKVFGATAATGGPTPLAAAGGAMQLGAPVPSAFAKAVNDQTSGKKTEVGGEFVFRFENAPPGLRYDAGRTTNPDVGVDVDMGFSLVGP